jgi:Prokaryotic E2 family E
MLPEDDIAFLRSKGYQYTVTLEQGVGYLVITDFPLPGAYTPRTAELLIRIVAGYPNSQLDMFWTSPDVKLAVTNVFPDRSDVKETYLGRSWQRWSRHWQVEWRPGVDGLETFVGAIVNELNKGR